MPPDHPDISPAWQTSSEAEGKAAAPRDQPPKKSSKRAQGYHPLSDTLRLYAGWLFAWYVVIYALGWYQRTRALPFRMPVIDQRVLSKINLVSSRRDFVT